MLRLYGLETRRRSRIFLTEWSPIVGSTPRRLLAEHLAESRETLLG
jgi:hypothetical protein